MARKQFWIGTSWKMNMVRAEARLFAQTLKASPVLSQPHFQPFIVPPFPSIAEVAECLSDTQVIVGAQNMHWADHGPWTGEVSPLMIKDCGATLVELGHSERREHFGETDETVALKTAAALSHGLIPLICIGDSWEEYQAGRTADVLSRQVHIALSKLTDQNSARILFAYEPVWSIGERGVPADPDFANEHHGRIKHVISQITGTALPVLYGGSVNRSNCVSFAKAPHIDGLFIGRSAWTVEGFIDIINAVTTALAPKELEA